MLRERRAPEQRLVLVDLGAREGLVMELVERRHKAFPFYVPICAYHDSLTFVSSRTQRRARTYVLVLS